MGIHHIMLLHCPENKYSLALAAEIEEAAAALFIQVNKHCIEHGDAALQISLVLREGLLYENLATILQERNVAIVFVGMKMLDERLSEIKKLKTAFYFMGT